MANARIQRDAYNEANRLLRGNRYRARILKALFEGGYVESGFENPDQAHSDRDSAGFLQQRPSQGWGTVAQVRNTRYATRQFVNRAIPIAGRYKSAGALAQAIQRSGFPAKYGQRAGDAQAALRSLGRGGPGGGGSSGGGGGGAALVPGVPGSGGTVAQPQLGSAAGAEALVKALEPPPAPPLGVIPAPRVMAGPVFPTVGGAPVPAAPSFGSPPPAPDVQDQIRAAALLRREMPAQAQPDPGVPGLVVPTAAGGARGGPVAGGKPGKVTLPASADRPGVKTKQQVLDFLGQVARISGQAVVIGTGTRHDRLTASGRVSDHWEGEAADTPARGRRLIQLGQAALIAAGMPAKKARRIRGGLFNIGRYQIIFNTNGPGIGDHTDHLHTGVR